MCCAEGREGMTNKPEEGPHVPDTVALLEAQAKRIATLEELRNEYRRAITLLKEDTRARIAELEAANRAWRDALKGEK